MADPTDDTLTDDDQARLHAITAAAHVDPEECIHLVHAYYSDRDRADRTPRYVLYLHLGLLSGIILRLTAPVKN